jgi:23S rRNA (cytidine1920-2'-O)/16S rRNA (cytidine1409-2'-O)-methyltransferase
MKQRLDLLLIERKLCESRAKAQALIRAGEVFVNGQRVDKAGAPVRDDAEIEVRGVLPYVSRGGYKLAAALDAFKLDVTRRVCADIGASTGGFTDVLLQRGAAKVYAIDVGHGQLDWRLRRDPRVVVMERTNICYVESLPEPMQFACIDVSFISLKLVLPVVKQLLANNHSLSIIHHSPSAIMLIKPQFEAGKGQVGKGGVVRAVNVHRIVLRDLLNWCAHEGWQVRGLLASPIKGPAGNVEFLAHVSLPVTQPLTSVEAWLDTALEQAKQLA